MMNQAAFIYNPTVLKYRFSDTHPFNQQRLLYTNELLFKLGALHKDDIACPAMHPAIEQRLNRVHTAEYISVVKRLSEPVPELLLQEDSERYGLSDDDTPYFPDMHDAALSIVSASMSAADLVMSGKSRYALHLGGGLHHAFNNKAAGFCVYNDASVAIAHIRETYDAKVLYIDTDVHHGDGVQATFYTDPDVCTFSIHETGKYLFPGTGFANERGDGEGFGYSFNLPMEPFSEDESWISNFREAITRVTAYYKPDVIISQHGCDAHYYDPLSHQHCSMELYLEIPQIIKGLADQWCNRRWVALGGGGYDVWRVVPRAWSLLWLVMTDHPLIKKLAAQNVELPSDWRSAFAANAPVELPTHWLDSKNAWEAIPRRREINEKNKQSKELALLYLP